MAQNPEVVDLSPSKETYQAVKADVNPRSAIKELVDNAIDNRNRTRSPEDPLQVEITYLSPSESPNDTEELIISDNSGGLEEDRLKLFFALGESAKENIAGSIGAYGIGAKKACAYLGDIAEFRTRHIEADRGYGFTVDEQWLNSDTWSVEKEYFDGIDRGTTEIRIRSVNFDWDSIREPLYKDLSETYEIFLGGGIKHEEHNFELILNGEAVKPPEPVDWSYFPLDGYFPRRYEGFHLEPDGDTEGSEPIQMHVTVGLMREASQRESGTDVFCQRRKVLVRDTGEEGGFGSGKHKLGTFGTGQKRLRIIVELETEGDAERLPWDAQKSHLNQYDPVAQEMYVYLHRVAKHYYSATYSKIPQSVLRPYHRDHQHAANGGSILFHDYKGRKRVTNRPDADAPVIKQVRQVAEAHAQLGIRYEEDRLKPEAYPAYHSLLEETFDREVRNELGELTDVTGPLTKIDYEHIEDQVRKIKEYARQHASEEVIVTNIPDWAAPRYHNELESLADIDDLSPVERELDLSIESKEETEPDEEGKEVTTAAGESSVQQGQTLRFFFEDESQRQRILETLELEADATAAEAANKLIERIQGSD
jgi:hypothetical protein